MTPAGVALLRNIEGCKLQIYRDSGDEPTIGIGHCLTRPERRSGKVYGIDIRNGITLAQSDQIFDRDIAPMEINFNRAIRGASITDYQRDALLIWCYNIGVDSAIRSTLVKLLHAGQTRPDIICTQLRRWIYDAGRVSGGLRYRREAECILYSTGDYSAALHYFQNEPRGGHG